MNQTMRPCILCRRIKTTTQSSTFANNTVRICVVGATLAPFNAWSEFCIILIFVKHNTLAPLRKRTATSASDVPLLHSKTKRNSRNSLKLDFYLICQRVSPSWTASCFLLLFQPYQLLKYHSVRLFVCSNLHTASPQRPITTIPKPP